MREVPSLRRLRRVLTTKGVTMNALKSACVILAIASCVAGCATPPPSAADRVRVTTALADVEGCSLLGKVFVGGTAPEKDARAEVVRLGGNVLLKKSAEVWNGNAYQCPAVAH
jgi:hypothetical protein